jgi:hypothetical protein
MVLGAITPTRGFYHPATEAGADRCLLILVLATVLAGAVVWRPEAFDRCLRHRLARPLLAGLGPLWLLAGFIAHPPPIPDYAPLAWSVALGGLGLAVISRRSGPASLGDVLPGLLFWACGAAWLTKRPLVFVENQPAFFALWLTTLAAWLTSLLLLLPGLAQRLSRGPVLLGLLLAFGLAVHGGAIIASPDPVHDAWTDVKYGTQAMLRGEDPYVVDKPSPYYTEHARRFALHRDIDENHTPWYPPGCVLSSLPAVALGLDHRWMLTLAWLGMALLAARQTRRWCADASVGPLLAGLLLLFQTAGFSSEQAYVDAYLGFWFTAGMVVAAPLAGGLLLALAITAKQSSMLLWAAIYYRWRGRRPALAAAIIGSAAIVLPFYFWSPPHFMHDVVTGMLGIGLWPETLCLPGFCAQHLGVILPARPMMALFLVVGWLAARRRQGSLAGLLTAAGFAHLLANMLNERALLNYYELAAALLLIGAAAESDFTPQITQIGTD